MKRVYIVLVDELEIDPLYEVVDKIIELESKRLSAEMLFARTAAKAAYLRVKERSSDYDD